MSRDKQIEETACKRCVHYDVCMYVNAKAVEFARAENCKLFKDNAGYRKASDFAREIFEEMREELVRYLMLNENIALKCKDKNGEWNAEYWKGKLSAFKQIQGFIDAELKKKYTEDGK